MTTNQRSTRQRFFNGHKAVPCFWCHDSLTLDDSTLDHVFSKAEGGGKLRYQDQSNVVLSCSTCNKLRGTVQGIFINIRRLQNLLEQYNTCYECPSCPASIKQNRTKTINRLEKLRRRSQPKLDEAKQAFEERCKIELRKGPAGIIYPVDPVPDLPPLEEMENAPSELHYGGA